MTARNALLRLGRGVLADVADYGRLREMLGEQFEAAVRHDAKSIERVAGAVAALTDALEERRRERMALARLLAPGDSPRVMAELIARMPEPARARVASAWQTLESLVRECKALNARNWQLLVDQHEIMQRVLSTESDLYAPA